LIRNLWMAKTPWKKPGPLISLDAFKYDQTWLKFYVFLFFCWLEAITKTVSSMEISSLGTGPMDWWWSWSFVVSLLRSVELLGRLLHWGYHFAFFLPQSTLLKEACVYIKDEEALSFLEIKRIVIILKIKNQFQGQSLFFLLVSNTMKFVWTLLLPLLWHICLKWRQSI